jgi:hypothetical protein
MVAVQPISTQEEAVAQRLLVLMPLLALLDQPLVEPVY